jgi:hypothetical protein
VTRSAGVGQGRVAGYMALFQPFQRLDSSRRTFSDGIGLGLAIVQASLFRSVFLRGRHDQHRAPSMSGEVM